MKIGIVTWFEYDNYGTKLQAYALYNVLKMNGNDVCLINFSPVSSNIKCKFTRKICQKLKSIKRTFKVRRFLTALTRRHEKMSNFISENCVLTDRINSKEDYITICNDMDLLIFGSDQIWNQDDFHEFYYADYDEIVTRRISYAPSFGTDRLNEINVSKYSNALSRFTKLSAREESGLTIIRDQLGMKAVQVVDPTLLVTVAKWNEYLGLSLNISAESYIVCYFLGDNKVHFKEVEKFARKTGKKLKIIPGCIDSLNIAGEVVADAGPKEFVELIKNAECVITDSFHAMLFSLIFERKFLVFYRFPGGCYKGENTRISQIIDEMNLHTNVVDYNGSLSDKNLEDIEYDVNEYINKKIYISHEYIRNI